MLENSISQSVHAMASLPVLSLLLYIEWNTKQRWKLNDLGVVRGGVGVPELPSFLPLLTVFQRPWVWSNWCVHTYSCLFVSGSAYTSISTVKLWENCMWLLHTVTVTRTRPEAASLGLCDDCTTFTLALMLLANLITGHAVSVFS